MARILEFTGKGNHAVIVLQRLGGDKEKYDYFELTLSLNIIFS